MNKGLTRDGWAVLLLAVAGAVVARMVAWWALGDAPHVQDEQVYVLQARTLAIGRLATSVALPRAAFNMWFVDDRWARFGIFPPGWPALLAAGVRLHAVPWVNPLLHAATASCVAVAAWRLGGRRSGLLAAAVYALSPQALLLASSLMSHALVAFGAAVVALVCVHLSLGTVKRWHLVAAGAALGITELTRPLCAVAVGSGLAVFATRALLRRQLRLRDALLVVLPLVLSTALLFAYNAALTGSPLRFPQDAYFDGHLPPADVAKFNYHPGCNDLGFGPGHGCEYTIANATHDLRNALSNTGDNLFAWLLLAGGGPLAAVALVLAMRDRAHRFDRLLLLTPAVAAVLLYTLYWYAGTCYGARFYHAGLPALAIVASLGLASLGRARLFVVTSLWFGWNALAMARGTSELTGIYWATDSRFVPLAEKWDKPKALVMLAFSKEPLPIRSLWWTTRLVHAGSSWLDGQRAGGALALNTPMLDGPIVFAKFHPALVDELHQQFPDRRLWLYVEAPRAEDDKLVPYDPDALGIPFADRLVRPPDNFDGYELADPK